MKPHQVAQPPVDVGAILAGNAQALGYANQAISTANQEATINLTTQQAVARFAYAQANQTLGGLQAQDQATISNIQASVTAGVAQAAKVAAADDMTRATILKAKQSQLQLFSALANKDLTLPRMQEWYQVAWSSAKTIVSQNLGWVFTAIGAITPRQAGAVQVIGGIAEALAGVAAIMGTGGLGAAVGGGWLVLNGLDNILHGTESVVDNEQHPTYTNQSLVGMLQWVGADPNATSTKLIAGGIELLLTLGAGIAASAGGAAGEAAEAAELSGDAAPVENAGAELLADCGTEAMCFLAGTPVGVMPTEAQQVALAAVAVKAAGLVPTRPALLGGLEPQIEPSQRGRDLAWLAAGLAGGYALNRKYRLRRLREEGEEDDEDGRLPPGGEPDDRPPKGQGGSPPLLARLTGTRRLRVKEVAPD